MYKLEDIFTLYLSHFMLGGQTQQTGVSFFIPWLL